MSYERTKEMHQYYRDVFTRSMTLSNIGGFSRGLVNCILDGTAGVADFYNEYAVIDQSTVEKSVSVIILAVALSNAALDVNRGGRQYPLPGKYVDDITNLILGGLNIGSSKELVVLAVQVLFRVGSIEAAIELININSDMLADEPVIFKIMLLICLIEEQYDNAIRAVDSLIKNTRHLDAMTMLMIVSAIYKNGGIPESYIDFRSLVDPGKFQACADMGWIIEKRPAAGKITVIVSCDPKYYWEHARTLVYSIHETNKGILDIHLHLYNPDARTIEDVKNKNHQLPELNISCSCETIPPTIDVRTRYASHRFIFAKKFIESYCSPVLILDADMIFRRHVSFLDDCLSNYSVVVSRMESSPFWEQALGGFVYLSGDDCSLNYITQVAGFINNNLSHNNAPWFLDQVALSSSLDLIPKESTGVVSNNLVCDINHNDFSVIWTVTTHKGNDKYASRKEAIMHNYETRFSA